LVRDVQALSSDEFQGRESGTPGARKTQEYIAARFRALGLKGFTTDYRQVFTRRQRSRLHQIVFGKEKIAPHDAANVIGYLRGARYPDDYIVVSAHFDHLGKRGEKVYHGADDNASGTAALLAIAKYFAAHPPQHSMIFAAFDTEEKGLQGSRAFVASPPVKLDSILLDVNMDMIGRNIRNELFVTGTYQEPELRAYVTPVRSATSLMLLMGHDHPRPIWDTEDDWTDLSDQEAFMEADIPALYVGVDATKDYHQPSDTFDKIDQKFFGNAAELVTALLLEVDAGHKP
jgi:Zn-dependent M28 family amino/carboxypeptidase